MSEPDNGGELIPIPQEGAKVAWLGFSIGIDFYPAIKLGRKAGLEFTGQIADILEPESVQLETGEWRIFGGGVCEGIQIFVEKSNARVVVRRPANNLEWYDQKLSTVLRAFKSKFEPKVALESNVWMSGLIDLPEGVDARAFLGGYVMLMHPRKFDAIDRPLDILGVRLYFPAYDNVDWGVNVRVESWAEDPTKVFLNADADWEEQVDWGSDFVEKSVARVTVVSEFISTRLVHFLRQPPIPNEEDEESGDEE